MGFDAGIYRYPKYKEKLTSKQLYYIEEYLAYQTGKWAKENFATPEEYALYSINLNEEEKNTFVKPSQEAINFYKSKAKIDEYGILSVSENLGYWCSNGGGEIFEWFTKLAQDKCNNNNYGNITVELTIKDVSDFALFCWSYISKHFPESCTIDKTFKYVLKDDENTEFDDEYDILLSNCDGIEVNFEKDNTTRRFETNSKYECEFFMPKEYYDDWEMSGYIIGLETALKIINTTDFDNEFIKYNGGW